MKIRVRRTNQSLFPIGDDARAAIRGLPVGDIEVEYLREPANTLTRPQQNTLHAYCEAVGDCANDHGLECVLSSPLLRREITVPWTRDSVKKHMWMPVQIAMYPDKISTKDLATHEVPLVADVLARWLATEYGLDIPFVCQERRKGVQ